MKMLHTYPAEDGFRMPGEWEPHRGCLMIWPTRPGSWNYGAAEAQKAFSAVAAAIAESEEVWMLTAPGEAENARRTLSEQFRSQNKESASCPVRVLEMDSDDAWARDVGPTFVKNAVTGTVRGIDWAFNAWGGTVDGLYAHWERDDAVAAACCRVLDFDCYSARPFVLEGGSVHSDGEGTILTTQACLLSAGRNPSLTRGEIEEKLKRYLGGEKVVWLKRGIYNDETNEHVDNICAFVRPGEVVLAWTDDPSDPQYELSRSCLEILERETDARGRHFRVHRLPIPSVPVRVTEEDAAGYAFEEGEDEREAGERLAASYVNFYIANGSVLIPQFGDANDRKAEEILADLFPGRKMVPIAARAILLGGGNIHCITQQIPL